MAPYGDGMTEASNDQVVDALKHDWDGAYEFGVGGEGYWARRRDGLGGEMINGDPGELRRMVAEDHATHPLRSHPDRPRVD